MALSSQVALARPLIKILCEGPGVILGPFLLAALMCCEANLGDDCEAG